MPAATPPLRIAVLGAGKIGSAFAFQFAQTGKHDVTVVARPNSPRLAQLERDQAIIKASGERAPVRVAASLDESLPYDLVVVTLLAHQIEALIPSLRRSAAHTIQFMCNTFQPERLIAEIGPARCAFGMPFIQATLDAEGQLTATIGAGGQRTIMSEQRSVDLFNQAGLPAALEPKMDLWLRCHAPLCIAFESICVSGVRRGGGASWPRALEVARGVHACFALIKSMGYAVYPQMKTRLHASPVWATALMLWAMSRVGSFRALLATGEAEAAALVEVILSAAPADTAADVRRRIATMRP